MASLWKHPKSKYWTACFTGKDGRQLKRSTKTTDKKLALKFAETLEEEYRKIRTAAQMQKVLQDVYRDVTGTALDQTTLSDYQKRWLETKKAEGCAEASLVYYRHTTERFLKFLGKRADASISTISQDDVERFRNSLVGELAPKTVSHQVKGLRMLFKAACDAQLIDKNPASLVKSTIAKRVDRQRKQAFRMDQISKLLEHCDAEWRGLILFGLYSAQRLADIQFLKWRDISEDCSTLRLITRKTGKRMTIPIAIPLQEHLRWMVRPKDGAAFIHPTAAAYKTNTLSGKFVDLLVAAGIRPRQPKAGPRDHTELSFHSLRHSAVTLLKEAGVPLAVVLELVGHSSTSVSQNYTHVGEEALEKAAAAFPVL